MGVRLWLGNEKADLVLEPGRQQARAGTLEPDAAWGPQALAILSTGSANTLSSSRVCLQLLASILCFQKGVRLGHPRQPLASPFSLAPAL